MKKAPAKPKAAPKAPRAAAKPKASGSKSKAASKKVLADHDSNADDDDDLMEVDEADDAFDADLPGPSNAAANPAPPKRKNKSTSETYTKVCHASERYTWRLNAPFIPPAYASRTRTQAPGLLHWECGDHHSANVDSRSRHKPDGIPRCQACSWLLQDSRRNFSQCCR